MTNTTTVTVLFTDVVGNTALRQRLGDEAARSLMREVEALVREQLTRHRGTEVRGRATARCSPSPRRGEQDLKGVGEPQRLFAVREATTAKPEGGAVHASE